MEKIIYVYPNEPITIRVTASECVGCVFLEVTNM